MGTRRLNDAERRVITRGPGDFGTIAEFDKAGYVYVNPPTGMPTLPPPEVVAKHLVDLCRLAKDDNQAPKPCWASRQNEDGTTTEPRLLYAYRNTYLKGPEWAIVQDLDRFVAWGQAMVKIQAKEAR